MNWLEVSLTVSGELAEAVAEVLARYAPNGVVTEQGVRYADDEDAGTPTGAITVRAYLEINDKLEETRRRLDESLYFLGRIQPLPDPVYKPIADRNWMEAWKQHYKPIPIGRRLMILPAWMDSPEPDRIAVKIDPGMAFGTGTHPSTQLCLELMEDHFSQSSIENPPSQIVIDVGCGSGILSIAAIKLGARYALGVDIDANSLKNAKDNAANNQIGDELMLGVGSVQEILNGQFPHRQAPLVVANILAPVLIRLFDAGLADLVADGGSLILGGILDEQAEEVIEAGRAHGMGFARRSHDGDWVALSMSRAAG